jgi:hypothetical protein
MAVHLRPKLGGFLGWALADAAALGVPPRPVPPRAPPLLPSPNHHLTPTTEGANQALGDLGPSTARCARNACFSKAARDGRPGSIGQAPGLSGEGDAKQGASKPVTNSGQVGAARRAEAGIRPPRGIERLQSLTAAGAVPTCTASIRHRFQAQVRPPAAVRRRLRSRGRDRRAPGGGWCGRHPR